jgi:protein involved in polysaccharide export with SLBB domain
LGWACFGKNCKHNKRDNMIRSSHARKLILFIIILFSSQAILLAQFSDMEQIGGSQMFESKIKNKLKTSSITDFSDMVNANDFDGNYYFVNAGDVFTIRITPFQDEEEKLIVSPEGFLLLPRNFGQLKVKGMSVSKVSELVTRTISEANPLTKTIFSFYKPRTVLVKVTGNVKQPKVYTLPANYQVSSVITIANSELPKQLSPKAQDEINLNSMRNKNLQVQQTGSGLMRESELSFYSQRNIMLFHKDGSSHRVDLFRADVLNSVDYDPYIREGDEIYVPRDQENNYPWVSINGAVNRPAKIPFVEGDRISMLLKFAKEPSRDANTDDVKLFNSNGGSSSLKVNDKLELLSSDHKLSSGSVIIVGRKSVKPDSETGVVSVKGNVGNPGTFIIKNNETTLKQILEMAGGATETAYLPLAKIIRKKTSNGEIYTEEYFNSRFFQHTDLTLDDTLRMHLDMSFTPNLVSVDFEDEINSSGNGNVLLQDGDIISLPQAPKKVFVFGKVNRPGYVSFKEGRSANYYIYNAGGFSGAANKGRTRIIRAGTYVWVDSDKEVMDGDMIYVPADPDISPIVEMQKYATIANAVGALIAIINLAYFIYSTN